MDNLKVSIVIPVYNGAKYLIECIDSVITQDYSDIEIVIINDCSSDDTSDILSAYSFGDVPNQIIENKRNHGVSYCRNCGIRKSHGDLILFVDADDVLAKNSISTLINLYKKHRCTIKYQCYLKYQKKTIVRKSLVEGTIDWSVMMRNFILNREGCFSALFLFNRSFLVSNNIFFNEKEKYMEELNFIEKLSHCEKSLFVLDLALYGYRQTAISASHSISIVNKIEAIKARFKKYCNYYEDSKLKREFSKSIVRLYLKTTSYFMSLEADTCLEYGQKILSCIDEVFQASNMTIRDCSYFDRLIFGFLKTKSYKCIKILIRTRERALSLLGEKLYE